MKKLVLSTAAVSIALGLASATGAAFAKEHMSMSTADMNKDGMVSKEEFLQAMAKMYDENMTKLKAMPAASQTKMMKDQQLTAEGFRKLLTDLSGGGR